MSTEKKMRKYVKKLVDRDKKDKNKIQTSLNT